MRVCAWEGCESVGGVHTDAGMQHVQNLVWHAYVSARQQVFSYCVITSGDKVGS